MWLGVWSPSYLFSPISNFHQINKFPQPKLSTKIQSPKFKTEIQNLSRKLTTLLSSISSPNNNQLINIHLQHPSTTTTSAAAFTFHLMSRLQQWTPSHRLFFYIIMHIDYLMKCPCNMIRPTTATTSAKHSDQQAQLTPLLHQIFNDKYPAPSQQW